ncbi:tRNA uridine-5-carboxymethylaminomethyl(34) synthesis enzyme MnmG [Candidatus Fermentibacteria bacterium]|nr:MAG: tRNA uridine-5-carboxymethylaminomethyl(34) synthesis enzyme MnmG [Candidatus Fermentibacteria bacterium]PIE52320.1 MAG: tRNA uridine-5-carboxymethylaminomethyl(34) synthesis enzyme MnmG [Candidatus Fermentibacteria bacterium]
MKTVAVIGGGHAGVEASCAAAVLGCRVILITPSISKIALMSCNPSIGGIAKGTLVCEIDAMGGVSSFSSDNSALQFRMLNMKKGPAVWGPRTQNDISLYCLEQRARLAEAQVEIIEGIAVSLKGENSHIESVVIQDKREIKADAFVLAAGTFLGGILHRGEYSWPGGRRGDISAVRLEKDIRKRMFHVKRFKTGTSPRVLRKSINTDAMELQENTEMDFCFSWKSEKPIKTSEQCWVVRTTRETERIIAESLKYSPLYSGRVTGKGPRYCPSFEDKVTKFPDRAGHPVHVEPTGAGSRISYINGFSTSLPHEIQERAIRSIPGFSNAVIAAYGYSVEYTCFERGEYDRTFRLERTDNLYAAGQILGTSGYEEASATGLLAGANAARRVQGMEEMCPNRLESYLGVLVDDLVIRGADEPYRLFSSRAENRLHLRQDNADRRLFEFGCRLGTVTEEQKANHTEIQKRQREIKTALTRIKVEGKSLYEFARRPEVTAEQVAGYLDEPNNLKVIRSLVLDIKYGGYVDRAKRKHSSREKLRDVNLAWIADYSVVDSLSIEAAQVLNSKRPKTLREAEQLSGVREADLDAIVVQLMKRSVSRET